MAGSQISNQQLDKISPIDLVHYTYNSCFQACQFGLGMLLKVKDLNQWLKLLKQHILPQDDMEGIWGLRDLPIENFLELIKLRTL